MSRQGSPNERAAQSGQESPAGPATTDAESGLTFQQLLSGDDERSFGVFGLADHHEEEPAYGVFGQADDHEEEPSYGVFGLANHHEQELPYGSLGQADQHEVEPSYGSIGLPNYPEDERLFGVFELANHHEQELAAWAQAMPVEAGRSESTHAIAAHAEQLAWAHAIPAHAHPSAWTHATLAEAQQGLLQGSVTANQPHFPAYAGNNGLGLGSIDPSLFEFHGGDEQGQGAGVPDVVRYSEQGQEEEAAASGASAGTGEFMHEFPNWEAAQAAMNAHLRLGPANDPSFPQNAGQDRQCVERLSRAISDVSNTLDLPPGTVSAGGKVPQAYGKFAEGKYGRAQVQMVAWNVLYKAKERWTSGGVVAPWQRTRRPQRFEDFGSLVDEICCVLSQRKTIAKRLFDPEFTKELVDNPGAQLQRAAQNKRLNTNKARQIRRGRQALSEEAPALDADAQAGDAPAPASAGTPAPPADDGAQADEDGTDGPDAAAGLVSQEEGEAPSPPPAPAEESRPTKRRRR